MWCIVHVHMENSLRTWLAVPLQIPRGPHPSSEPWPHGTWCGNTWSLRQLHDSNSNHGSLRTQAGAWISGSDSYNISRWMVPFVIGLQKNSKQSKSHAFLASAPWRVAASIVYNGAIIELRYLESFGFKKEMVPADLAPLPGCIWVAIHLDKHTVGDCAKNG